MHPGFHTTDFNAHPARRLTGVYVRWSLWYLLAVAALWIAGYEGIYYHPTPFYGLLRPAFDGSAIQWHLLALAVGAGGCAGWMVAARKLGWFEQSWSTKAARFFLAGVIVFGIAFPAALAMVRGGPEAIPAPYERQRDEYIGDIGKGLSIGGLFRDYAKMHPHLSMHSKVHPPGPVALLWLISLVVFSQAPTPLAIATIVLGALAILPLYFWVKDMTNASTARTACCLYAAVPTIALFTATSTDILFMPFTIGTLFLFWRAIERRSVLYALAAGAGYGVMSLLSFSLIGVGAFFGFVGLWRLAQAGKRLAVVQTAALMLAAFLGVHGAVWLWSGFDVIEVFRLSKTQFETDQAHLDIVTPRFPAWTWKLLNPFCWFYFAGIPVSILFLRRVFRPDPSTRGLFWSFASTLLALNLLYLARGEGERSAMYIIPFLVAPAAHMLDGIGRETRSLAPMAATLAFLVVQCWFTEAMLYTYW